MPVWHAVLLTLMCVFSSPAWVHTWHGGHHGGVSTAITVQVACVWWHTCKTSRACSTKQTVGAEWHQYFQEYRIFQCSARHFLVIVAWCSTNRTVGGSMSGVPQLMQQCKGDA